MAHLENGYSQVANETLEALARILLSPNEYRLIMVVFRLTYGFGRKWARISMRTYSRFTEIDVKNCHRTERRLRDRNIIKRQGERVKFQKYSEKWKNVGTNDGTKRRLEGLKPGKPSKKRKNVGTSDGVGTFDGKIVGTFDGTLKKKETLIKTFGQEFVKIWEGVLGDSRRFGRQDWPKYEDPILEAAVKRIGRSRIGDHKPQYEGRRLKERFVEILSEEIIKRRAEK